MVKRDVMTTNIKNPAVRILHLSKSYGNITALCDVNLEIYPGEILAIVGDNGAGKSTLIKILAGAVAADSGFVQVGGNPISPYRQPRLSGWAYPQYTRIWH